ncbi:hypothetical protein SIN8267_02180 [Sinobacterium norvegicum]|uniref:Uncharacterized protein n=1 Tax=Sinobacterium norvegicum TaxID=1641715 RepID=A0ABM9AFT0_9GAMM|nr:hypothetical protein [Sinobacterium norvegicum]CAH0992065.1 hypothetical protein SIN8267_02180 [Sinobacterium norvegicum]
MSSIDRSQLLTKRIIIGLRYYDFEKQNLLQQKLLYGVVVKVMEEDGIVVELAPKSEPFTLPSDISSWHPAPSGSFVVDELDDDVVDPDYLVRWDIVRGEQSNDKGEHEWWQWQAISEAPTIDVETSQ